MATVVQGSTKGPAAREGGKRNLRKRTGSHLLWLFIAPAAIFYSIVVLIPAAQGLFFSMTNWDGLRQGWDFIGFHNFTILFADPVAVGSVTNTFAYAIITTVFENLFGLLLALALNSRIKSRNFLRVIFFLPVVLLSIVIAYLWKFIFLPNNGVWTNFVSFIGLGELDPNVLGRPDSVIIGICVMVIWQFTGFTMIIYLAGLQGVPPELLESASLDGAGVWSKFWHITWPLLAPALTVNLILSMIRGFMIFDQIWAATLGGPADSSHSMSTLVYRTAFQFGRLGQGAALSVVLTVFVALLGFFQYRAQMRAKGNQL